MLVPKRVKHRKVQRGSMKGKAKGGTRLNHGSYGVQVWVYHGEVLPGQKAPQPALEGSSRPSRPRRNDRNDRRAK